MIGSVNRVLAEHYGIAASQVDPLLRGHTNQSFAIDDRYVLRRAWAGKPARQIEAEERVLSRLATAGVPRIIPARDGMLHVLVEGRAFHLFERCAGAPGPRYLDPGDCDRIRAAMARLASLHAALLRMGHHRGSAWQWLAERCRTVCAGDLSCLPEGTGEMLDRIGRLIPTASAECQSLHGDYHPGNLLWVGGEVSAVVDFDETGMGSAASEAAMALFAFARQETGDEPFAYDTTLWHTGEEAYRSVAPFELPASLDALKHLFCAYQVLIHLGARQRELWMLDAGIGFWPCWNWLIRR